MGQQNSQIIKYPPNGVSYERTHSGFRIECSSRRWGDGLTAIAFTTAWCGVLVGAIISTQDRHGGFMPWLWLAMSPFLLTGGLLLWATLLSFIGKVIFDLNGNDLRFFAGLGPTGLRRTIAWKELSCIEDRILSRNRRPHHRAIYLDDFVCQVTGMPMIGDARRYFTLRILKVHHARPRS